MNEDLLDELEVTLGLLIGVWGDDAHAQKWRPQYRREVRALFTRVRRMGLGEHPTVRRLDVAFYVFNSHRFGLAQEVDPHAAQKREDIRKAIRDLFGQSKPSP